MANVGSLVQPLTRAQYQSQQLPIPLNLFSHSDQQLQWQTALAQGHSPTGWAGRAADYIAGQESTPGNFRCSFRWREIRWKARAFRRSRRRSRRDKRWDCRDSRALRLQRAAERVEQPADHRYRRVAGAGGEQHAGERHQRRENAGSGAGQSHSAEDAISHHRPLARNCSKWRRSSRCSLIWGCGGRFSFARWAGSIRTRMN